MPLEFNYTEVDYNSGYRIWPPLMKELVNNTKNKTICKFLVEDICDVVRPVTHSGAIVPFERRPPRSPFTNEIDYEKQFEIWPPLKYDYGTQVER